MGVVKLADYRPNLSVVESQVADLNDGYTRIANELLEAVMAADLTARQLKVVMAVTARLTDSVRSSTAYPIHR